MMNLNLSVLAKSYVAVKAILCPSDVITESQRSAIDIVTKLCAESKTDLLQSPTDGTRYLILPDLTVKITPGLITIINGSYAYHIQIPNSAYDIVTSHFNDRVRRDQDQIELHIEDKINKSLNSIAHTVSKIFSEKG